MRLLETGSAQDWFPLCRFERNCRFRATIGAYDVRLSAEPWPLRAVVDPALPATLRVVRELLFAKESLLAGAEDELGSAICALQNPIRKLHGRPAS